MVLYMKEVDGEKKKKRSRMIYKETEVDVTRDLPLVIPGDFYPFFERWQTCWLAVVC